MGHPEKPNTISPNEMHLAAGLAKEIREHVDEINDKLVDLNHLGFANARVTWSDATRKIEFHASRTTEFKL